MKATPEGFHRCAAVAVALVFASAVWSGGQAQAAVVQVIRVTAAETAEETQVSIVASGPVRDEVRNVQPNWIVVDILGAELGIPAGTIPFTGHLVKRIRVGQFERDIVRVVVELARPLAFRVTASNDRSALLLGIPTGAGSPRPAAQARTGGTPSQPDRGEIAPRGTAAVSRSARAQTASRGLPTILPGEGIGPVRLGMSIGEVLAALGPQSSKGTLPDGSAIYRWFAPPKNSGLGVRVTPAGVVYRVWALNDSQFAIKDRIRAGSTEDQIRKMLGRPSQVMVDSRLGMRTLTYGALGLWVAIQLDKRYAFYNTAFEIGVMEPGIASHAEP